MESVVLSRRFLHRVVNVIVLLVVLGSLKESNAQITIIEEPKSTTVIAGNPVSLNCTATAPVSLKYSWQFMGKKITSSNDGRVTIRSDGTLEFANAQAKDNGDYVCVAIAKSSGERIKNPKKKSRKALLTVQSICSASTLTTDPDNPEHAVDSKIEMTCDCPAKPSASIVWSKDGTPLSDGGRLSISGNSLVIDKLKLGDAGNYECNATNAAGSKKSAAKTIKVIDAVQPSFDQKPPSVAYTKLNGNFKMDCRATGTPTPTIEWYYGTQSNPLITSSKHTLGQDGSLTILSIESNDFAIYKCVAKNFLNSISADVQLKKAYNRDFSFASDVMYAEVGDDFSVRCRPDGGPKPVITWQTEKGGPLPASYVVNQETVKLNNVKLSDSANITCAAKNMVSTKKAKLRIVAAVRLTLTSQSKHTNANENSKIKLECSVSGSPPLQVTWTKNMKTLQPDSFHKINSNNALVFKKVSQSDRGIYQCFVRSALNMVNSKPINLTVNAAVRLKQHSYNHNKFNKGSNSSISCAFTGHGAIKVTWHRADGKPVGKNVVSRGNSLYIYNIRFKDEAIYVCTGSNSFSNASAPVNVSVYIFPRFVVKPSNTTAVEFESVWLHCNATGLPKPKISWGTERPGGDRLDKKRFREFENGSLHIENIRMTDQGRYYCFAGNIASFKQITISLRVVPPPEVTASAKASAMGRTIAIAVGCAAAYIVLVVGLMIYCKRRRAKQQKKEQLHVPIDGDVDNCEANPEMALQPINGKPAIYNKMEFPRHDLEALRTLGNGSYGRAFLARASGIKDGERETTVVVKSLMSKDDIQKEDFWRELNALINMDNPHVVALLGVCREMDPIYMIFESLEKGDLKQYLLSCYENGRSTLTSSQKLSLCSNIVSGMTYLASNNFVHKDVAARNCMVTKDLQVKIGFLNLSYDLYSSEYYRFNNILIPLRWMAPEAISNDEFSEKSDVWSYGVLVWEVYTLGQTPFEDRSDEEVLKCIKDDLRLSKPENCPDTMASVMKKCWDTNPDGRPTFDQLYAEISEIAVDTHL